jgi:cytochrome c553
MLKTNATRKSARARAFALLALAAPIIGGGLTVASAGARGFENAPSAASRVSARTAAATNTTTTTTSTTSSSPKRSPDFDRDIRPILAAKCFACHGPDAESRKAGLRLDTFEGATAALENGVRAIAPGSPETSTLLVRVASTDLDDRMPPEGHDALTATEIASLRAWISSGAEYTAPWAFRPLADAAIPAVADESWAKSDIDRFVLATRERAGLAAPTEDASPTNLLRRASFDLVGLPPTEEELRAFLADPSEAQFAAFVDSKLASAAFGERWGRHWLDLARYAETLAHEFDYEIPHAWRYRDYVIEALNADVPLGRFVAEQIAGDMLEPRAGLELPNVAPIATLWWFLGPATHAPVDVRVDEADRIAGSIDVAGRSFFSLSIACARCHDHKFDPVPASDFFALAGVARNTRRIEAFLPTSSQTNILADAACRALVDAAQAAKITIPESNTPRDTQAPDAAVIVDHARGVGRAADGRWSISGSAFVASGSPLALTRDDTLRLAERGSIDSARLDTRLVGSARSPAFSLDKKFVHVRMRGGGVWARLHINNYWLDDRNGLLFEGMRRQIGELSPEDAARDPREVAWRVETWDVSRFVGERAYLELIDEGAGWIEVDAIALSDAATPPDFAALDEDRIAETRDEGALFDEAVVAQAKRARDARDQLVGTQDHIRAIVAEDSGSFDEPLHVRGVPRNYGESTARAQLSFLSSGVAVEGSGRQALAQALVDREQPFLWRTMANRVWLKLFGRGIAETPDDFGQLGASPWSIELLDHLALKLARDGRLKPFIREIVLSRAYRAMPCDEELPPAAWAPVAVRRLDAEAIRDAMLVASGRLDATVGGPSVPVHLTEHMQGRGRPGVSGPIDGNGRRSVYISINRNFLDPFLQAFDQPPPATTCGKRHTSNVPAQALALLNNDMVREFARVWGERLAQDAARTDDARIESMWLAAFARLPREEERSTARAFLETERAATPDATRREAEAFGALAHALFSTKEFVFLR